MILRISVTLSGWALWEADMQWKLGVQNVYQGRTMNKGNGRQQVGGQPTIARPGQVYAYLKNSTVSGSCQAFIPLGHPQRAQK